MISCLPAFLLKRREVGKRKIRSEKFGLSIRSLAFHGFIIRLHYVRLLNESETIYEWIIRIFLCFLRKQNFS